MGPQKRAAIAFELSDNVRDIAFESYRSANATLNPTELQLRFVEHVLGWRLPHQLRSSINQSCS
jgi:hypothetical protein